MSESNEKKPKSAPQLMVDPAPADSKTALVARKTAALKPQRAKAAPAEDGPEQHADDDLRDAVGLLKGIGATAWRYAVKHPGTAKGALAGFILAVLILTVGLWDTIVIAVFVFVGALIGQMRDGDNGIVNFFNRLFGGRG